jgi:hypothetical protein
VRTPAALLGALALALAGCGTPSADLLAIERTGSLPDAQLDLVVSDGNTVTCDGRERPLSNELLLDARDLAEDLQPLLDRGLRLPAPSAALLRYRVIGEAGEVRFADASPRLPSELGRLVRFTRAVARESCGRDR